MAFDESQRGRGLFYSDRNKGSDSTIESAYMSTVKANIASTSESIIIDGKTINQIINEINTTTQSLQDSINLITQQTEQLSQQNSQINSQIETLTQQNSQLIFNYGVLIEEIEQLKQGQSLPIASTTQLGVIKVGSGLQIEEGTLNSDVQTIAFDDGPGGLEATNVSDAIQELTGRIGNSNPHISEENEEELIL